MHRPFADLLAAGPASVGPGNLIVTEFTLSPLSANANKALVAIPEIALASRLNTIVRPMTGRDLVATLRAVLRILHDPFAVLQNPVAGQGPARCSNRHVAS